MRYYFDNVTPFYTGGGIYCFTGKLKNGSFFLASDLNDDITELDTDPETVDSETMFDWDWIEEHHTKFYNSESEEAKRFFISMLRWIIKNKPQGANCNYNLYDMKNSLGEYQERLKKGN